MKFTIDTEECDRLGIDLPTALYLIALYKGYLITDTVFHKAGLNGYLVYDGLDAFSNPMNPRLTEKGADIIETFVLNSEFRESHHDVDRYDMLADKLRDLFPTGRKPGTSLMWKDSTAIISKRLKTLVKKHGVSFTDEEAIDATRKYIDSFNGNYTYMQVLKYFISKQELKNGSWEESSQFLSYLANKDQPELGNDWRDNVR